MKADTQTFRQLLDPEKYKYIIPFFQRGFVWDKDDWDNLYRDILASINSEQELFLGSIVLKKNNTGKDDFVVIDGQQRLTTLCILCSVVSLITKERKTYQTFFINKKTDCPILEQAHKCHEDFKKIMCLDDLVSFLDERTPSNVMKAYEYFKQLIEKNPDECPTFTEFLTAIKFVRIDLVDGEDEQKIFDTINSLGVRLTTADLLKNFIFEKNDIATYNKTWASEFEKNQEYIDYWEKDIKIGRLTNRNIDLFLYYFLQIKYFKNKEIQKFSNLQDEKNIRKKDILFSNYKKYIENFGINKLELADEIIEYAKSYRELINLHQDEIPQDPGLERLSFVINYLDCTTVIPYILYISLEVDDEEEKMNIYQYIEKYLLRRILADSNNNNYSDLFTENMIGQKINSLQKLKKYIENDKSKDDALSMPSDERIIDCIKNKEFNNDKALSILYLIESSIRSKGMSTKLHWIKNYSLEHLMPKKWEKNWKFENNKYSVEDRNHLIKTLGNMGIITTSLNSTISNSAWKQKLEGNDKRDGLKKCAKDILTLQDVLMKDKWDESEIEKRSTSLTKIILDIWPCEK